MGFEIGERLRGIGFVLEQSFSFTSWIGEAACRVQLLQLAQPQTKVSRKRMFRSSRAKHWLLSDDTLEKLRK